MSSRAGSSAGDGNVVTFAQDRKSTRRPSFRAAQIVNPEAERVTLGSLMLAGGSLDSAGYDDALQVLSVLEPADFNADGRYPIIFRAMQALHKQGRAFGDQVEIDDWLREHGQFAEAGGTAFVSSLVNEAPTGRYVLGYARTMFDVSIERQTQQIAAEGVQRRWSPDELAARLHALVERKRGFERGATQLPGVMLSEVEREPVHWLWPARLAFGKVSGLDGDGGEGKGLITLDLTACATTGRPMPGETEAAPPMNVILIAPEDSAADTLRPRLEAAGGDATRVRLLSEIADGDSVRPITFPRDTALLEEVIQREGARLVIVDPIMACLDSGVKTNIDNEVRAALMPLKQVIERTGVACILVRHYTKASDVRAAYRGGGSVAFTNIARFGWSVTRHPDNPDLRILMVTKSNYRKPDRHLVYRIEGQRDDTVRVAWELDMKVTQDPDALMSARGSSERFDVVQIIEEAGGWVQLDDIAQRLQAQCDESGEPMPKLSALRMRLSRYKDAGAIQHRAGGWYAPRWLNDGGDDHSSSQHQSTTPPHKQPLEGLNQLDVLDVLDVLQSDCSEEQASCNVVTHITPNDRSDTLCYTSSSSSEDDALGDAFSRPTPETCDHPQRARHRLERGWTCGLCGALVERATSA